MDARKVVVTLVCATEDAEALDDVVDGLSAGGLEVELVVGVDEQPRRVGEAIERCGEWGLLVVCTSAQLDGPNLRKVERLFSARRGAHHAMIRIDVGLPPSENAAEVRRAVDAFVQNQGRIVRRHSAEGQQLREVIRTGEVSSLALPVVRLEPGEELDGDTRRIQLPDNPKSAELSRRRRAARERERERERITKVHRTVGPEAGEPGAQGSGAPEDPAELDRLMVMMIIGAGVLAVLAALTFSGVF
jgi:hypothetical protein